MSRGSVVVKLLRDTSLEIIKNLFTNHKKNYCTVNIIHKTYDEYDERDEEWISYDEKITNAFITKYFSPCCNVGVNLKQCEI